MPTLEDKIRLTTLKMRAKPLKYLFILGHMRSGSSLLVHLLGSNPGILGYGENHLFYNTRADFDELLLKVTGFFKTWRVKEDFVMDKVLHNRFLPDLSLLKSEDVYVLFLSRNPEKSLPSIVNVYTDVMPKVAPEKAGDESTGLNYYITRMETLAQYATEFGGSPRTMFLTYEDLLDNSTETFSSLQSWLGLEHPFSESYKMHDATGVAGKGDYSELIKKGHIERVDKNKYQAVTVESMTAARAAYQNYLAVANKYQLATAK